MKHRVKKAFILAAGFGTRMLPLTKVVPKPMLPLWGIPMIDRTLDLVQSWGVEEVVVNVHHGADVLVKHLVAQPRTHLRIQLSFEPGILGTGGALTRASWFFSDGKPFWVVNADVGARVDVTPIIRAFKPGKTIASSWLMATKGPRTVECAGGVITNFRSRCPGAEGTYTFCGVHLVDPGVLKFLPGEGFASIIDAYEKAMKRGWKVAGVPIEQAWWSDLGTPAQYIQAHRETAVGKKKTFISASKSACIEKGAGLRDCIVLENARVGNMVRARDMIIGPGVYVSACSGVITMRAEDALDQQELDIVRKWSGSKTDLVASFLSPRGSSRVFTRIYSGRRSAMLIRHDSERTENNLYARHTQFLAGLHLPVPDLLAEDKINHLALFEDAGSLSVQDEAPKWSGPKLENVYRRVLDSLAVFHKEGGRAARRGKLPLMEPFNAGLYAWEHQLFTTLFLKKRMRVDQKDLVLINKELKKVSARLLKLPSVLLHRDLQSSNIMLRGKGWRFIDYQGMRFGPAVYDLASLLCDPYIKISRASRECLLYHYRQAAGDISCEENFWYAAVQRLGQALGAYARLSSSPATVHFAKYIRPALLNMKLALAHIEGCPVLERTVCECLKRER